MPKKKKTREQKILAEVRRRQEVVSDNTSTYSLTPQSVQKKHEGRTPHENVTNTSSQAAYLEHYTYLLADFRKTAIVTVVIVALELILHYFLK